MEQPKIDLRKEDGRLTYGYFLVAYLDLLGQRDELMKLVELPFSPDTQETVLEILQRSAARVKVIRDAFALYFSAAISNAENTPEHQLRSDIFDSIGFRQTGFADSFVIAVPLEHQYGPVAAAAGIWASLYGIGGIWLTAMSLGVPMRGGVDVERGIDLFPNEVYGPAAINAYTLESQVAEYPRVVVGDGLRQYLDHLAAQGPSNHIAAMRAAHSRHLICKAPDDGRPMLHMLAPDILAQAKFATTATEAYAWVTHQCDVFSRQGNAKLESRYMRLLQYFQAHGFPATAV